MEDLPDHYASEYVCDLGHRRAFAVAMIEPLRGGDTFCYECLFASHGETWTPVHVEEGAPVRP